MSIWSWIMSIWSLRCTHILCLCVTLKKISSGGTNLYNLNLPRKLQLFHSNMSHCFRADGSKRDVTNFVSSYLCLSLSTLVVLVCHFSNCFMFADTQTTFWHNSFKANSKGDVKNWLDALNNVFSNELQFSSTLFERYGLQSLRDYFRFFQFSGQFLTL